MNQTTKSINRESTKLFLLNYFPILIFFALSLIMVILLNVTSLKIFLFFIITAINFDLLNNLNNQKKE